MTGRKKNIIGHDPLAWISVDDELEEIGTTVESSPTIKSTTKIKSEPHPLGIDVDAFISGFDYIQEHAEDIFPDFYTSLFSEYPDIEPLFADTNVDEQGKKLANAINLLVTNINDVDRLVSVLTGLGKSHQKYGASAEHFTAVIITLLTVIKKHIGRRWTKNISENWSAVLNKGAEIMLSAYQEEIEPPATELTTSQEVDSDELPEINGGKNELSLEEIQDISTVNDLLDNIKNAITKGEVIINISNVSRIDASCLQVLYILVRDADINDYEVKITGSSEAFERSVHLMGMTNVLKVAA